jgi:7-carboxy-7-deazaguanine synthase (Cx14CxxC type)
MEQSHTYSIKEIFLTLQGEGFHSGRPAIFCRFTGCNFWNGREEDRSKAICTFCDTDFIGTDGKNGGKYTAANLSEKINSLWPAGHPNKFIVCTGGEPLLQLDEQLIQAIKSNGFEIAVESNGSVPAPDGIDWLTVSPKSMDHLEQKCGNELKLVYPQKKLPPTLFESLDFDHFFLQPMDGPNLEVNTKQAIAYCLTHPKWKLSMQTHKYLGID